MLIYLQNILGREQKPAAFPKRVKNRQWVTLREQVKVIPLQQDRLGVEFQQV